MVSAQHLAQAPPETASKTMSKNQDPEAAETAQTESIKAVDPAAICSASDVCECQSWCHPGGWLLLSHHPNCTKYTPLVDCREIIMGLLRGIEASAQDTDGIHPALWEAYKRGKASVWEFDWKEQHD
jgi:hypothetical protein